MVSQHEAPIPVTVVGGYLGAGKTTLVNNLLRAAAGRRLAVLVNEFGALPIDADLIEAQDDRMIAITGGCICCSYGSDLVAALIDMGRRTPKPDQILVETSGVALPGGVASALSIVAGLRLDAVLVLADAETVRERAEDRYTADTITRQLADADIVVLNKTDLLSNEARAERLAWMQTVAPQARILPTSQARVPADVLLLDGPGPVRGTVAATHAHHHVHDAGLHASEAFAIVDTVDADRLARELIDRVAGLVRAKGFVATRAGPVALQIVGRRPVIEPAPETIGTKGRLVVICVGSPVDRATVEAAIAAAR
ncbi:MAG: GTP-binding protein [Hyphomicrobiales bacterium]|nr:MAG: GTP-binding protein [Hyphomicrobiales bacterium]